MGLIWWPPRGCRMLGTRGQGRKRERAAMWRAGGPGAVCREAGTLAALRLSRIHGGNYVRTCTVLEGTVFRTFIWIHTPASRVYALYDYRRRDEKGQDGPGP